MQRSSASQEVDRISADGPLAQSKLAWNLASYKESLLYRAVALVSSCAASWNRADILGCALVSRAFIETTAVMVDVDRGCGMGASPGEPRFDIPLR
jgi:hypothetical protein